MKDILQPLFNQFMPFAQKRMGFNKPPRVFLRDDPENAQNPLGKTAYYDPEQMSVVLYTNGRHPKDIMRSLAHELVHHTQNCNGEFDNVGDMGEGYAQNDPHLREMERRAYEKGNLCFRDWEDSIKGTIYIQNLNVDIQKEGKLNMSTKDWKNRELPSLLTEKWGFSFNMLTESQEEEVVEEGMCPACGKSPCCCPAMEEGTSLEEGEYQFDPRSVPECEEDPDSEKCRDAVMMRGMQRSGVAEGEELEEGGAALRDGNEDRLQQRHAHPDRLHEEEEDENIAARTPPRDEENKADFLPKSVRDKIKMDEAQIRQLIRKLVKEAMNRKETK
jgi:hypothetical protein